MTTPADARATEAAFEAALAGRPVPAGARGLTAFTDAVRAEASAPGRPNAALAELLATGLLPDASTGTVGRPARSSRKRPRMILSTLVAKFVAAGAVAKVSVAGGAVAALALTGAVTTDVIPLPGEDTPVVEAGDVTDGTDDTTTDGTDGGSTVGGSTDHDSDAGADDVTEDGSTDDVTEDGSTDATVEGPGDVPPLTAETWAMGPQGTQTFSQWVSSGANASLVRGEVVSCFAQARRGDAGREGKPTTRECQERFAVPEQPVVTDQEQAPVVDETEETDSEVVDDEPAPAATGSTGTSSGSGHGNSGGNGNGNGAGNGNGGGHGNSGGNSNGNGGGRR
jgi:uncharacterized membrane protein YgcG